MCDFVEYIKEINFNNYTLIIPSVSVGNVGQLAVDLLISSYNFEKAATFWHPAIIASIGADPFDDKDDVCLACELYVNENLKLATIQLRTSIEFSLALSFFKTLNQFIVESKFVQVIILTSSFAHLLTNPTSIYYYLSNDEHNEQVFKDLQFEQLKANLNDRYVVEGSGFGVKLYETLISEMKCTILIKYVSEGDNRNDAATIVEVLKKLISHLNNKDVPLKCPQSWKFVFGNPSPVTIF